MSEEREVLAARLAEFIFGYIILISLSLLYKRDLLSNVNGPYIFELFFLNSLHIPL